MMYAVPLSTQQQQQQQQQQGSNSEPSSSSSEWGAVPGNAHSPNSSGSSGPWGSAGPASMADITNKPSPSTGTSNGAPAPDWTSPTASASVWQTSGASNESGDSSKNSWPKNALLSSNSTGPGQQGQDKENHPLTPVSTDRSPLDHMIYRQGWGQVEVKQEVPWAVPESPPPVHEDPSMWKPKANTGTEVWEKSTGHRTQPWQNQAPNTPRWISDDERDEASSSSVWNGTSSGGVSQSMSSGPGGLGGSGGIRMSMNGVGGVGGGNGGGNSILRDNNGPVSQVGRPTWNSAGPGSGGSGASSGGNISPTNNNSNQWNDNVQDQEWSEWRDPSSITKRENVNGTDLWGSSSGGGGIGGPPPQQNRSSNNLYGNSGGSALSNLNSDPRKSQSDERPRGWQDSANYAGPSSQQMQQPRSSAEWSANDNEWRGSDNEKSSRSQWGTSGRDQQPQQQRPPSPPTNVGRYSREEIYQSKQYQGLLAMGFKREDIDTAMRNNNMNYEATLSDLKRRQQQRQQMQMQAANNSGFGGGMGGGMDAYKTGLPGAGVGAGVGGGMMNGAPQSGHPGSQMQQQQQAGKNYRPVPNIHALAQQLSIAAKQGIINPRLLTQPLAPQTTFLLHKLMGQHRNLQHLNAQQEMAANQKPSNPSLQQQQQGQLSQYAIHIQQTKKEIMGLQKQIDVMQNEYAKSPMDPRFQGGDLASASMSPPAFPDFHTPAVAPAASYNPGWRMPDPGNPYSSPLMGGGGGSGLDSWGNMGGGGGGGGGSNNFMMANSAFSAPQVMPGPMWNDPNQWGGMHGGAVQSGMNSYRGMAPAGNAHSNMEDWTGHMSMKSGGGGGGQGMSGGGGNDALSPSRGGGGGLSGNGGGGFGGMDDTDGSHWGDNRQRNVATFANANANSTFSTFAWETLPEFEPGKPWRGSQLLSADDDPHLTPGSVQNKNPLMNAVTSGNGGGSGGGGGGGHYNSGDAQ